MREVYVIVRLANNGEHSGMYYANSGEWEHSLLYAEEYESKVGALKKLDDILEDWDYYTEAYFRIDTLYKKKRDW